MMWFGTAGGLSRFDGGKFNNFTIEDGLPGNIISNIYQTQDGRLWISVYSSGVAVYDKQNEKFTIIEELKKFTINTFYQDAKGTIWFGTNSGKVISNQEDKYQFHNLPLVEGQKISTVSSILKLENNYLLLGTDIGLIIFDGQKYSKLLGIGPDVAYIGNGPNHRGILVVNPTSLYFWNDQELSKLDLTNVMVNQRISSIHQEPDNSLWISGGWGAKGVLRFKDGRLTIYSETDGIMGNDVSCAYKSRNGIMWFGVQGKGAAQYETAALTGFDNKDGLDSTSITLIEYDNHTKNILLSGYIDSGARNKPVLASYDGNYFVSLIEQADISDSTGISSILSADDGTAWIGTSSGIILLKRGKIKRFLPAEGLGIFSLSQNQPNGINIATGEGLFVYYQDNLSPVPISNSTQISLVPRSVFKTTDKQLWVTVRDNSGKTNYHKFSNSPLTQPILSVPHQGIFYTTDNEDNIWASSWGQGVFKFRKGNITNFVSKDRLANDFVRPICQGQDGVMWFGTNGSGLVGYDGKFWTSLDSRDSIMGDIIMSLESDQEGNIWCGTYRSGLVKYKKTSIKPKVKIDSVTTSRTYLNMNSIVKASVGERVTVKFHAIDFITVPEKRQYRCRILTHENSEIFSITSKKDSFEYRFKNSGEYKLTVQAINRDLNLSAPESVTLDVILPWYLNGWITFPGATLGVGSLVLVFIFSTHYYRKKRELQELEQKNLLEIQLELDDAKGMQMALLPEQPPTIRGLEIAGRNIDAKEVGGDFFDYLSADSNQLKIAVGDVSGKGLKGAMNAVMASGILNLSAEYQTLPSNIMSDMNNALCQNMEQDMNVTMVLAHFNMKQKQMSLANAGQHAYPLLKRGTSLEPIKAKGLALGMMPSINYKPLTVEL